MPVRVASPKDVETMKLDGRDLKWLVTPETLGTEHLSIAMMYCHPHAVVRPMHSHAGIEEVILILQGCGVAWVDGETASFTKGDAVLFPADSKHQVKNASDEVLITASIFSEPTSPDSYTIYPEDAFGDTTTQN